MGIILLVVLLILILGAGPWGGGYVQTNYGNGPVGLLGLILIIVLILVLTGNLPHGL